MADKIKNLAVRTFSGIVLLGVVVAAVFLSRWSFGALLLAILIGGMAEFYRMAEKGGASPQKLFGITAGTAFLACNFMFSISFSGLHIENAALGILIYVLLTLPSIFVCEMFRRTQRPMANIGATFTGIVYVALPIGMLCYIPLLANNMTWDPLVMLFYIFIIWANDVFAYLVGMSIGRHKLCERISPNKTWEGFFGGVAGAVAMGLTAGYVLDADFYLWGGLALVASVTGVLGDLVESMFKRSTGVKDSGNIMPGHGGWLDRFDALLLSAPFVFIYLLLAGAVVN